MLYMDRTYVSYVQCYIAKIINYVWTIRRKLKYEQKEFESFILNMIKIDFKIW